jgi:hypothetical protein
MYAILCFASNTSCELPSLVWMYLDDHDDVQRRLLVAEGLQLAGGVVG